MDGRGKNIEDSLNILGSKFPRHFLRVIVERIAEASSKGLKCVLAERRHELTRDRT